MQRFEFDLFADYFQFYIQDEFAKGDLSDSWTAEAISRLLALAPGVVGIGTVRNMDVPVSIELHDAEPPLDLERPDHIVECTIEVGGSRLVVAGCTDYFPEASRMDLVPGVYRVRVSYEALNSLSEDGLTGNDRYLLQLWQAPRIEPTILKQRVT